MRKIALYAFALLALTGFVSPLKAETLEQKLVIKDHKFLPAALEIPAGQKVKLVIENQDATAEEFESHDLKREKIVAAQSSISVYVGPLTPGVYKFFGEFHEETAQGTLTVK